MTAVDLIYPWVLVRATLASYHLKLLNFVAVATMPLRQDEVDEMRTRHSSATSVRRLRILLRVCCSSRWFSVWFQIDRGNTLKKYASQGVRLRTWDAQRSTAFLSIPDKNS